jgi:hypothetical protein
MLDTLLEIIRQYRAKCEEPEKLPVQYDVVPFRAKSA